LCIVDSTELQNRREREGFDERGKRGASGRSRRGGDEKDDGMLLVVRALRKSTGESWRLPVSRRRGAGGRWKGPSDSEEESSEVSSSDSASGSDVIILEGVGGAGGKGTALNESDK
jgi:hypothetical protein